MVRQAAGMLCLPRSLLLVLAVAACGTASADPKAAPAPAAGVKTIIVVRHAEAEHQPGGDPSLTADGRARALELARVLTDTQLSSVYITHYQRNRQTAAPLSRKAGDKPPRVIDPSGPAVRPEPPRVIDPSVPAVRPEPIVIDDVPATVAALRAEPWGATALVIGHSNTVPDLVRGLTGNALPASEPIIFDRMWIVTLARDGTASLLRVRYGAPAALPPPPPPAAAK
jgi:broad specificity phosphatase PhoE